MSLTQLDAHHRHFSYETIEKMFWDMERELLQESYQSYGHIMELPRRPIRGSYGSFFSPYSERWEPRQEREKYASDTDLDMGYLTDTELHDMAVHEESEADYYEYDRNNNPFKDSSSSPLPSHHADPNPKKRPQKSEATRHCHFVLPDPEPEPGQQVKCVQHIESKIKGHHGRGGRGHEEALIMDHWDCRSDEMLRRPPFRHCVHV